MGVVLNSLGAAAIGLLAMHVEGLWLERIIAVRWLELAKLTRLAAVLFVGALDPRPRAGLADHTPVGSSRRRRLVAVARRLALRVPLVAARCAASADDDFQRVLVVGSDQRVLDVVRTFAIHPEAGMHVVGLVGSQAAARAAGLDELWLGEFSDLAAVLARTPTDCAIVGPTDEVGTESLDLLLQTETDVYSVPARGGIAARRISATAFANELLIHVDPVGLSPLASGIKRTFDVLVSSLLLVLTAPLFAGHRRGDQGHRSWPGAVQAATRRPGRAGVRGAQVPHDGRRRRTRWPTCKRHNARSGPLFKMAVDPRVTRVGRFLRATSLDELPQLINVVRGDDEPRWTAPGAAQRGRAVPRQPRASVMACGRASPACGRSRRGTTRRSTPMSRLDVFYVKNWSLALDIVIMLGTVEQLVMRPFIGRKDGEMSAVGPRHRRAPRAISRRVSRRSPRAPQRGRR